MDRIAHAFDTARAKNRACFVAYLCAGDPDFNTSVKACQELTKGAVDVLELAMPFSDPLADGITNQLAAQRALNSGMTQEKVFELIREVRSFTDIPIVLYTYYNLVYSQGTEHYVNRAREVGVDGLLTLDLPPEEAGDLLDACGKVEMKNIFIIAPTTPSRRIELIAESATGFIYYVSLEGVTGVRSSLAANIKEAIKKIKKHTTLPVVVGFGISTKDQVREVASCADGVVVGSALVNCVAAHADQPEEIPVHLSNKLSELIRGID